ETPVPESTLHDQVLLLARLLWLAWLARQGRSAYVAHNLALRFVAARPEVGLDPDLALYEPPPPRVGKLRSVRTWRPGHAPPKVALEVVSKNHPTKDYRLAPVKYDASGTGELWVFDPLLAGPREGGGPHLLHLWARGPGGRLERAYAGAGPVRSPFFGAWLVVVDEEGPRLRLSDDPQGRRLWPTPEEAERAAKEAERRAKAEAEARAEAERRAKAEAEARAEAERAAKEAERAAKDEALARLARVEAELAALRRGR
ncbi:MAG TPA: Uma2 family endonuclease, partial [Polyangiaceae bacterium]|nr:Uma2 family endonuclease [Polyangiaceae bacterium]